MASKKNKESKFAYNPAYAEGYAMLQSLRNNALRTGSYAPTGGTAYVPEEPERISLGYTDENIQRQIDAEKPWYQKFGEAAWDHVTEFPKAVWDTVTHPLSMWNSWFNRLATSNASAEYGKLGKLNNEADYIEYATEYDKLVHELLDINLQLSDPNVAKSVESYKLMLRAKELNAQLDEMGEYIMTEGRRSDVLRNIFFDPDKADAKTTAAAVVDNAINFQRSKYSSLQDDFSSNWQSLKQNPLTWAVEGTKDLVNTVANTATGVLSTAGNALLNLWPGNWEFAKENKMNAIASAPADSRLYDSMFKSYRESTQDPNELSSKIAKMNDKYNLLLTEQQKATTEAVNYLHKGDWWYDPENIDAGYKERQAKAGSYGNIFANIVYGIPEMGSSFQEYKTFLGLIGTDIGVRKAMPLVLKTFGKRVTAGMTVAEAADALLRNKRIENTIGLAEGAFSLWATQNMRRAETLSETNDALTERVVNNLFDGNMDVERLLKVVDEEGRKIGLPVDKMDVLEKINAAIQYNMRVGDSDIDTMIKNAWRGLDKVYNANNALAMKDYLEALPFMPHLGSVLSRYGKGILKSLKSNSFRVPGTRRILPGELKLIDDTYDAVKESFLTSRIDKIIKNHTSDAAKAVALSHKLKFWGNFAKQVGTVAAAEGIEEGQQSLLTKRFARGEYDNYDKPRTMFDLPEWMDVTGIGFQAVKNYIGIGGDDPENADPELRKAMNIGATTAIWFLGGHLGLSAITDLIPGTKSELWDYRQQMKADKMLQAITAEGYLLEQDNDHVGIFFDALNGTYKGPNGEVLTKNPVPYENLRRSFEDMKGFYRSSENTADMSKITSDRKFVDDDLKLLAYTNIFFNNNELLDNLGTIGIQKGSEGHRVATQNAVRAVIDESTFEELVKQNRNDIGRAEESILNQYETGEYTDPLVKEVVDKFVKSYKDQHARHERAISDAQGLLVDEYRSGRMKNAAEKRLAERYDTQEERDKHYTDIIHELEEEFIKDKVGEKEYNRKLTDNNGVELDEKEYVSRKVKTMLQHKHLLAMKKAVADMKDLLTRQKILREESGTDINTEGLSGMIQELEDRIERIESAEKKVYDVFIENDPAVAQANKLNAEKVPTKDEFIESMFGTYENAELDQLYATEAVNTATLGILSPVADAYRYRRVNPERLYRSVRQPMWSELSSEEQSEIMDRAKADALSLGQPAPTKQRVIAQFNKKSKEKDAKLIELRKKYKDLVTKLMVEGETGNRSLDYRHELDKIEKLAAELYVQAHVIDSEDRKRIAHRRKILEAPVTQDEIDRAGEGDKEALDKLKYAEEQQKEEADAADAIERAAAEARNEEDSDGMYGDEADNSLDHVANDILGGTSSTLAADDLLGFGITEEEKLELLERRKKAKERERAQKEGQLGEDAGQELHQIPVTPAQQEKSIEDQINDGVFNNIDLFDFITNSEQAGSAIYDVNGYLIAITRKVYDNRVEVAVVIMDPDGNEVKQDVAAKIGFGIPEGFNITAIDENHTGSPLTAENYGRVWVAEYDLSKPNEIISNGNAILTKPGTENRGDDEHHDLSEDPGVYVDDTGEEGNDIIDELIDEAVQNEEDEQAEANTRVQYEAELQRAENELYGVLLEYDEGFGWFGSQSSNDRSVSEKERVERDMLTNTFFYNNAATEPIVLSVNGRRIKTKYKITSGSELAKKLTVDGWLNGCDVYYVVTGNDRDIEPLNGAKIEDQFTVAMVIDDHAEQKTYVTTLRETCDYRYKSEKYGTQIAKKRLKIFDTLGAVGRFTDEESVKAATEDAMFDIYKHYNPGEINPNRKVVEKWFNEQKDKKVIDMLQYLVRLKTRRPGYPEGKIFTNEQIEKQINSLTEFRRKIIAAYCEKDADGNYVIPTELKTDVRPTKVTVTNGKINSKNSANLNEPIFHRLTGEDAGFDLSNDIVILQAQLDHEAVAFGYGTGEFGTTAFNIRNVKNDPLRASVDFGGKGLCGKIYYILRKKFYGRTIEVPIMLREARFDTFTDSKNNRNRVVQLNDVKLSIDPRTGKIVGDNVYAAEVLLYMLIGKLDLNYLPVADRQLLSVLVDLFVNNGSKTLATDESTDVLLGLEESTRTPEQIESAKRTYYRKKELSYDPKTKKLTIGAVDGSLRQVILVDKILNDEAVRKNVVFTIAKNMHFNTDIAAMNASIPDELMTALKLYFSNHHEASQFSICGVPEFTFAKDDFFETDDFGNITRPKSVSLMAWMLKTGKLMTNVEAPLLIDPFVYGEGINKSGAKVVIDNLRSQQTPESKDAPSPSVVLAAITQEQKKLEAQAKNAAADNQPATAEKANVSRKLLGRFGNTFGKIFADKIIRTKELYKEFLERSKAIAGIDEKTKEQKPYITDVIVLDVDDAKFKTKTSDNYLKDYKAAVNSAVDRYVKYGKDHGLNIDMSNVSITIQTVDVSAIKKNKKLPTLYVYSNGLCNVYLRDTEYLTRRLDVTGMFSHTRGRGKFNKDYAKQWLHDTFGIDENDVVVRALGVTAKNEKVFGVMQAVRDWYDNPSVKISLDPTAGRGIQFHEGWHYASLLLFSPSMRTALYREYAKQHNIPMSTLEKDVEEMMAEDFRKYMEIRTAKGLSGKIRRAFDNIVHYFKYFNSVDHIRTVYKNIEMGEYKNSGLTKDALEAFEKYYDANIHSDFYIPGVSRESVANFKGIADYHTFYNTSVAIANKLLDDYDLNTIDKIKDATNEPWRAFLEMVKSLAETTMDPLQKLAYEDIYNNPQVFVGTISRAFSKYGISMRMKHLSRENEIAAKDLGERSDNLYDSVDIEVSKKDNVAFRAKLFLTLVKKGHFEYDENGNLYLEYDVDPIYGWSQFWDYNEAWNKLLKHLYNSQSYNERGADGQYKSTSVMGNIVRLAKTDPFFEQIRQRLEDDVNGDPANGILPDIQLQNLIFGTVKSSKNHVAVMWLHNQKPKPWLDDDPLAESSQPAKVLDPQRDWDIMDDSNISTINGIVRDWSNNFASSGAVTRINGVNMVSSQFRNTCTEELNWFKSITKKRIGFNGKSNSQYIRTAEDKERILPELTERVMRAYNQLLGIPIDQTVFDLYIARHNNSSNPADRYDAIISAISMSRKGSLLYFLDSFSKSVGASVKIAGKSDVLFSEVYKWYKGDAEISKLAQAYDDVYPSQSDFTVRGPSGKLLYPIGENNMITDRMRAINQNDNEIVEKLRSYPYAKNSIILDIATNMHAMPDEVRFGGGFQIDSFVGIDDRNKQKGGDYFEITPLEDYIAKLVMTNEGMIILPTMADKKTWYAIKHDRLKGRMVFDLITNIKTSLNGEYKARRFSDKTLSTFKGYYLAELDALLQYYDRDNIKHLIENPNLLVKNYHGGIYKDKKENTRLDFSGNGGLFRYFYGVFDKNGNGLNLNEKLEAAFEYQKLVESGKATKIDEHTGKKVKVSVASVREGNNPIDGFEQVRAVLNKLKQEASTQEGTQKVFDLINDFLMALVDREIKTLSTDYNINVIRNSNGMYANCIPVKIRNKYNSAFREAGYFNGGYLPGELDSDTNLSIIASHVANTMISTIETETLFSGDSAFYKYKYNGTKEVDINGNKIKIRTLSDKYSDKIKRLGSVLSTGQNLRVDYDDNATFTEVKIDDEIIKGYPELEDRTYTFATVADVKLASNYLKQSKTSFAKQYLIDLIDKLKIEDFDKYVDRIQNDDSFFNKELNRLKRGTEEERDLANTIENLSSLSVAPYANINVCDAQVCIRPALYRKLRIAVGEWSFEPNEDGYSDEIAYNILEKDNSWMTSPKKCAIVNKFQLKPLKMVYFANDPQLMFLSNDSQLKKSISINKPVLDKMAIFPVFKFTSMSKSGQQLYERMNREGDEIDMLGFDSAVKTGAPAVQQKLVSNENQLTTLNNLDAVVPQVQSLDNLRLQLNTDAHEAMERGLGTQFVKIGFSNVLAQATYQGKSGQRRIEEIFSAINALTLMGARKIRQQYYNTDGSVNQQAIQELMQRISKSNQLGVSFDEILSANGVIASLNLRSTFEQSVISSINRDVIDVNTHGGAAVQQSTFGFVGYNKDSIYSLEDTLNGGAELKWNKQNGSMEVMLSANFFRHVLPKEIKTYKAQRQWLINHDFINGFKSLSYGVVVNKEDEAQHEINKKLFNYVFFSHDTSEESPQYVSKTLENFLADILEKIGDRLRYKDIAGKDLSEYNGYTDEIKLELLEFFKKNNINENDTYKSVKVSRVKSQPKIFGVGYRIPTQGMSSTFAFTVADILPEVSGDVIIVPREFTSQTGSDFDVDKIFLATKEFDVHGNEIKIRERDEEGKYIDKKLDECHGDELTEELSNADEKAVRNILLNSYISILTEKNNFSSARQSLDVVTDVLRTKFVDRVQQLSIDYLMPGYELTPSFQSLKKLEFSTGKTGIGAFALNVTNCSLTQAMHLCLDTGAIGAKFGGLGKFDRIIGDDNLKVSDWLSAMVNAHVDVAKDPYIFTLNVNSVTWNYVNLLLRSGKGVNTFAFIAQPALAELANRIISSKGLYGNNVTVTLRKASPSGILRDVQNKYLKIFKQMYSKLDSEQKKAWADRYLLLIENKETGIDFTMLFDLEAGIGAINRIHENNATIEDIYRQVVAVMAYKKLAPVAEKLSNLVMASRIDTKKQGNTIVQQIHYVNNYNQLIYAKSNGWYISDGPGEGLEGTDALKYFFENTFLDSKLNKSFYLLRDIFSEQSFAASHEFDDIFHEVMERMFGYVEDDNGIRYYTAKVNGDTVNKIGNCIDAILRTRAMLAYSHVTQTPPLLIGDNWLGERKSMGVQPERGLLGESIDLTCGGDKSAVVEKIKFLMFGNDQIGSLFTRVANLILACREHPENFVEYGIIDQDGNVRNEFLNYLRPQNPTKQNPYGRLLLKTPVADIGTEKKAILMSAFDQLLSSAHPNIKRLARDIAFYAYYSTYDTKGGTSFFDLVPSKYRSQYDNSLSRALHSRSLNFGGSWFTSTGSREDFLNTVARNYWYDNDLFKVYTQRWTDQTSPIHKKDYEYHQNGVHGDTIPSVIITQNTTDEYFKLEKANGVYLYKKIGVVNKQTPKQSAKHTEGEQPKMDVRDDKYIYALIPKVGYHSGSTHIHEFIVDDSLPSMFEENSLPDTAMVTEEMLSEIEKMVTNPANRLKEDAAKGIVFSISYYGGMSPNDRQGAVSKSGPYYEVDKDIYYGRKRIGPDRSMSVLVLEDGESIKDVSDVSVDVSSLTKNNVDSFVNDILKKLGGEQAIIDSIENPKTLFFTGNVNDALINKDDIVKFLKDTVDNYRSSFSPSEDMPQEVIDHNVEVFKQELAKQVKVDYPKRAESQILSQVIQKLMATGILLKIIGSANETVGLAASIATNKANHTDTPLNYESVVYAKQNTEVSDLDRIAQSELVEKTGLQYQYEVARVIQNILDDAKAALEQLKEKLRKAVSKESPANMTTEELVGGDGEMAIDAGQLFGPTQRIETTPTALIPADVTPQSTDTQTKLSDDVVGDEVAIDASMLFGTLEQTGSTATKSNTTPVKQADDTMFGDEPSIDAGALFDLGINPEDAKAIDDEGKKNNHKCKNK